MDTIHYCNHIQTVGTCRPDDIFCKVCCIYTKSDFTRRQNAH